MGTLAEMIDRLNARERALIVLLLLVAVPFALVFLVLLPVQENRTRALVQLSDAQAELTWIEARHAEWVARTTTGPEKLVTAPVGLSGIETALRDHDLRGQVRALENADRDGINLRLEQVDFGRVARFLDVVDNQLGYDIDTLAITAAGSPGDVDVLLELLPDTAL